MSTERPLSTYLRAGWEVVNYAAGMSEYGMVEHNFHLRRNSENKIVSIRRKMLGSGVETRELDV